MIIETCICELNENDSIHGLIPLLGKTKNKDNKLHLITSEHKLKFNLKKDTHTNKKELKLGENHTKTSFSTPQGDALSLGVLCTKRNKTIGEKRAMSHEIVDTLHVLEMQNFKYYGRLNPMEITSD